MNKNLKKLAEHIITHIGGVDNLESVIHCTTRLRFKLKDKNKANISKLKEAQGVIGVFERALQLQVIIGTDVAEVYEQIMERI
ncbi:MAG: PTS glucose/sucrose transporter subunit IIB [Lachnospiraceae bacterium]